MKIIVTGCFGFIGFNFLRYIQKELSDDIQITGIDNLNNTCSIKNMELFKSKNFHHVDLDINNISELKNQNYDILINFAAESHVDNSISNPMGFANTNVLGTMSLLNYALKNNINRFIHISTDEVYGSSESGYFSENEKFNPSSPYSASKASAENFCNAYRKTYDQNIIILRPCNNYGPFQQPEKLIPFSVLQLLNDNNIEIYGKGKNIRNWINVKDTSRAILHVIEKEVKNQDLNISTDYFLDNIALAKKIVKSMNLDEERISFIEDRPGHDFRYAADNSKILSTGWKPIENFDISLEGIIDWYQSNEKWWKINYENTLAKRSKRFLIE